MSVQLPNEGWVEMPVDITLFKPDREIDGIQYGWYNGSYIAIKLSL